MHICGDESTADKCATAIEHGQCLLKSNMHRCRVIPELANAWQNRTAPCGDERQHAGQALNTLDYMHMKAGVHSLPSLSVMIKTCT